MTHDEITAKFNAVPDSRRPSHVHRADYATDAEYSAAKVAFYSNIIFLLWSERRRGLYRRQIRKSLSKLRDWKAVARKDADAEKYNMPGLITGPLVRIKTAGGMTLTAQQSDVMIYPVNMRLLAKWDMRHGLNRDSHFNTALPFHMVASIEYAR